MSNLRFVATAFIFSVSANHVPGVFDSRLDSSRSRGGVMSNVAETLERYQGVCRSHRALPSAFIVKVLDREKHLTLQ